MSIESILRAFNDNAGAVQAIAACMSAGATIALIIVTVRYVKLTSDLVETAQEQIRLLQAGVAARQRELLSLLRMFRTLLSSLPSELHDAKKMRDAALWDSGDLAQLQRLASELDQRSGQRAATAANALRWLREQIEAREIGRSAGRGRLGAVPLGSLD